MATEKGKSNVEGPPLNLYVTAHLGKGKTATVEGYVDQYHPGKMDTLTS